MRIGLFALIAALSGCSTVVPSVQYREIKKADDMAGMTDSFYLQASSIVVEKGPETTVAKGQDQDANVSEFTISSKRVASKSKYGIKSIGSWRSETKVNLTKIQNTDLINSAGIEVTDKTAKAITDYGGAVVKLIGLTGGLFKLGPTCTFPVTISVEPTDDGKGSTTLTKDCVAVELGPLPIDATKRSEIIENQNTSNYYYSACRDAKVTVDVSGTTGIKTKTVRVSDPRYVQFVQFPSKGAITSHSECGVSVETQQAASDDGAAIIGALATQAKAIKDALDAAKK